MTIAKDKLGDYLGERKRKINAGFLVTQFVTESKGVQKLTETATIYRYKGWTMQKLAREIQKVKDIDDKVVKEYLAELKSEVERRTNE